MIQMYTTKPFRRGEKPFKWELLDVPTVHGQVQ